MAANAGVTLDTIVIEIESNAEKASTNLSNLTKTLMELKSAVKGGFNNINKLANGLKELNKVSTKIPTTAQNLDGLKTIATALKSLTKIKKPTGMTSAIKNLAEIPAVFNKFDTSTLENVSRVSSQLSKSLTPLANKLGQIGSGYSAINQLADRYGVSVTKVNNGSKKSINIFGKLGRGILSAASAFTKVRNSARDFGKVTVKQFGNVYSKIKQVGLSLLGTRTLFTAVRKAVSEYMQMDNELTDSTTNLWRAIGAQLAPAIEYVIHLFTLGARVVYSFVKAITGIDFIARANAKAMSSWKKSTDGALGSLQKFDDLNTVDFGKGSNDNKLIELDTIDLSPIQKILDLVRQIKEEIKSAFNTGEWYGVGRAIADLLSYSVSKIKSADIKKALKKISKPITDTLNGIIIGLDWYNFGAAVSNIYTSIISTVGDFINGINFGSLTTGLIEGLLGFDPSSVLNTWLTVFESVNDAINDIIFGINNNWGILKKEAREVASSLASIFNEAITGINWGEAMKAAVEGVNTIIEGVFTFVSEFDWSGFGETIGEIVNSFFKNFDFEKLGQTLTKFLSGLLQSLSSLVKKIEWDKIGESIVRLIISVDWGQVSTDLLQFMEDLWGAMLDAASDIGASLGEFISSLFGGDSSAEDDARTFGEKITDALVAGATERSRFEALHMGPTGIGGLIAYVKGAIKSFFGIHSPSTWARDEIGENISKGFANGLSGLWKNSKNHFITFVNGVIDLINKMINSINNKLKISIGSTLSSILKGLGVKVNGGTYQLFSIPTIPKLETGTNEVPYEGLYHLHPGEAVVPKKYNPAVGNGGNDETNEKLDTLIAIMNNMNFTNVVNIGNETIYKKQQRYNKTQNDKYGTTVNL